ncbi:hypothetical protein H6P81_007086 [Aristolochia fimbriata]|uniref:Uncharacterized protein n=1 Tax=Aristolochia fimbriata TaxID=158543 RepID=A0AAV7F2K5_ARIFI|nr:hypothetical protein H6P81_007086 [Aristolochia fimbriata]
MKKLGTIKLELEFEDPIDYGLCSQFISCNSLHAISGATKVEFMPKFTMRGIWQRWRESCPTDGSKVDDAVTVFTESQE